MRKTKAKPKVKYSKTQLRMGRKVESEHSKSRKVQTKIAKDHLRENPKYYTILKKCEKQHE